MAPRPSSGETVATFSTMGRTYATGYTNGSNGSGDDDFSIISLRRPPSKSTVMLALMTAALFFTLRGDPTTASLGNDNHEMINNNNDRNKMLSFGNEHIYFNMEYNEQEGREEYNGGGGGIVTSEHQFSDAAQRQATTTDMATSPNTPTRRVTQQAEKKTNNNNYYNNNYYNNNYNNNVVKSSVPKKENTYLRANAIHATQEMADNEDNENEESVSAEEYASMVMAAPLEDPPKQTPKTKREEERTVGEQMWKDKTNTLGETFTTTASSPKTDATNVSPRPKEGRKANLPTETTMERQPTKTKPRKDSVVSTTTATASTFATTASFQPRDANSQLGDRQPETSKILANKVVETIPVDKNTVVAKTASSQPSHVRAQTGAQKQTAKSKRPRGTADSTATLVDKKEATTAETTASSQPREDVGSQEKPDSRTSSTETQTNMGVPASTTSTTTSSSWFQSGDNANTKAETKEQQETNNESASKTLTDTAVASVSVPGLEKTMAPFFPPKEDTSKKTKSSPLPKSTTNLASAARDIFSNQEENDVSTTPQPTKPKAATRWSAESNASTNNNEKNQSEAAATGSNVVVVNQQKYPLPELKPLFSNDNVPIPKGQQQEMRVETNRTEETKQEPKAAQPVAAQPVRVGKETVATTEAMATATDATVVETNQTMSVQTPAAETATPAVQKGAVVELRNVQAVQPSQPGAGTKIDGEPLFSTQYCDVPKLSNFDVTSDGYCKPDHTYIPNLYDDRPEIQTHYSKKVYNRIFIKNREHRDLPEIKTLVNGTFIIWQAHKKSIAGAWNDTEWIEGKGWRPRPEEHYREPIVMVGNYVAYTSWYEGNYGHYFDDHLPSIAYLKAQLPWDTKFLLLDKPLARDVLKFLDPVFYERIVWIPMRKPIRIIGNLIVNKPLGLPLMLGCARPYDFLRHWITTRLPQTPKRRTVVYYSRNSQTTFHGRVLETSLEEKIVASIRQAMVTYQRPEEELVVFNGDDKDGNPLSIEEQFHVFRAARTIIGPHGAGMLGNFAWISPMPGKCEKRVQVLEFVPSEESTVVQPLYQSLYMRWRHWPAEFHTLLYTKESTANTTHIQLSDLEDALRGMWGPRESPTTEATLALATTSKVPSPPLNDYTRTS